MRVYSAAEYAKCEISESIILEYLFNLSIFGGECLLKIPDSYFLIILPASLL